MSTDVIEGEFKLPAVQEAAPLRHFFDVTPDEQIAMMTEVSIKAKAVIDDRHWYAEFVNKRTGEVTRHVEVEGWQFIGSLMRCSADVTGSRALEGGWEASAIITRADTGIRVSGGDGMCTRDEWKWKDRESYALRGMAQTRAISRAFRHIFSFVAELAGYSPTPAAEMLKEEAPPAKISQPASKIETVKEQLKVKNGGGSQQAAPTKEATASAPASEYQRYEPPEKLTKELNNAIVDLAKTLDLDEVKWARYLKQHDIRDLKVGETRYKACIALRDALEAELELAEATR